MNEQELREIEGRLATCCYGDRWTDVLRLTDEIRRLSQVTEPKTPLEREQFFEDIGRPE